MVLLLSILEHRARAPYEASREKHEQHLPVPLTHHLPMPLHHQRAHPDPLRLLLVPDQHRDRETTHGATGRLGGELQIVLYLQVSHWD